MTPRLVSHHRTYPVDVDQVIIDSAHLAGAVDPSGGTTASDVLSWLADVGLVVVRDRTLARDALDMIWRQHRRGPPE